MRFQKDEENVHMFVYQAVSFADDYMDYSVFMLDNTDADNFGRFEVEVFVENEAEDYFGQVVKLVYRFFNSTFNFVADYDKKIC